MPWYFLNLQQAILILSAILSLCALPLLAYSNSGNTHSLNRYSSFDYHYTDLQISRSTQVDKDDNRLNSTQYHVFSNIDVAWVNGNVALHGDREDGLAHSHIRFDRYFLNSKTDENKNQNSYISHIAVGDLDPQGLALTRENRGRGFLITNQASSPSHAINQQSIEGNGLPGWWVELYSNGLLIGSYQIGQDGRYQFDHLNMFLGKNTFVLKWTAPNGAQYSETKTIYHGNDVAKAGKSAYRFSAIQPERSLLSSTDPSSNPQASNNQVNLQWAYRVNNIFSVDMGAQHTNINDQSSNNVQAGLQAKFNNTVISIAGNKPNKTKARARYEIGHQIDKTRFLFSYTKNFTPDFITEEINNLTTNISTKSDQTQSLYQFDIVSVIDQTSVRFNAARLSSHAFSYQQYQLYLSKHQTIAPYKHLNWFNRLAYNRALDKKDLTGELTTRFLTKKHRSDLVLDYKLNPNTRLNNTRFSHYLTLASKPSSITKTYFDAKHQFKTNQSEYTLGISWENRYLSITPEFSYASGDIKSGRITFNTDLYKDKKDTRKRYQLKPHSHIGKESTQTGVTR